MRARHHQQPQQPDKSRKLKPARARVTNSTPAIKFESDSSSESHSRTRKHGSRQSRQSQQLHTEPRLTSSTVASIASPKIRARSSYSSYPRPTDSELSSDDNDGTQYKKTPVGETHHQNQNQNNQNNNLRQEKYQTINELHTDLQGYIQAIPCRTLLQHLEGAKRVATDIADILETHNEAQRASLSKSAAAQNLSKLALSLGDLVESLEQIHLISSQSPDYVLLTSAGRFIVQLDSKMLQDYPQLCFVGTKLGKGTTSFLCYLRKKQATSSSALETGRANYLQMTGDFTQHGQPCQYELVDHKSRKITNEYDATGELSQALSALLVDHLGLCQRVERKSKKQINY